MALEAVTGSERSQTEIPDMVARGSLAGGAKLSYRLQFAVRARVVAPPPVEQRDVHTPVLVTGLEMDGASLVEQIRVEDDRTVLAVGYVDGIGTGLGEESLDRRLVVVVGGEIPVGRR